MRRSPEKEQNKDKLKREKRGTKKYKAMYEEVGNKDDGEVDKIWT